jgi:hypothetical protein
MTNHPFKTPGSYQRKTGYQYSADVNSVDADSKTASTRLMPARNTCYQGSVHCAERHQGLKVVLMCARKHAVCKSVGMI